MTARLGPVAIVGGGNMGTALARGLLASRLLTPDRVRVSDPGAARRIALKRGLGVSVHARNTDALRGAAVVVLCVKPAQVPAVAEELGPAVPARAMVLSVAAGVTTDFLAKFFKPRPVIRVMPNTPALVGAGALAYCLGPGAGVPQERVVRRLLAALGLAVRVREDHMDAVTALSGSGPAYVFHLAECLVAAGKSLGLPARLADRLARQTVYGAGRMLTQRPENPGRLRRQVTSPGGTTEAALAVFAREGFEPIVLKALAAAARRSRQLTSR